MIVTSNQLITTGVYGLTKEDTLLSDKACGCVEAIR